MLNTSHTAVWYRDVKKRLQQNIVGLYRRGWGTEYRGILGYSGGGGEGLLQHRPQKVLLKDTLNRQWINTRSERGESYNCFRYV